MTTTIDANGRLQFTHNGKTYDLDHSGKFDWNGAKAVELDQEIGIVEEAINLGDIQSPSVPSWFFAINTDNTNFVRIAGAAGETPLIQIDPQRFAGPFRLAATAPTAIADTAACLCKFLIVEKLPDA